MEELLGKFQEDFLEEPLNEFLMELPFFAMLGISNSFVVEFLIEFLKQFSEEFLKEFRICLGN